MLMRFCMARSKAQGWLCLLDLDHGADHQSVDNRVADNDGNPGKTVYWPQGSEPPTSGEAPSVSASTPEAAHSVPAITIDGPVFHSGGPAAPASKVGVPGPRLHRDRRGVAVSPQACPFCGSGNTARVGQGLRCRSCRTTTGAE